MYCQACTAGRGCAGPAALQSHGVCSPAERAGSCVAGKAGSKVCCLSYCSRVWQSLGKAGLRDFNFTPGGGCQNLSSTKAAARGVALAVADHTRAPAGKPKAASAPRPSRRQRGAALQFTHIALLVQLGSHYFLGVSPQSRPHNLTTGRKQTVTCGRAAAIGRGRPPCTSRPAATLLDTCTPRPPLLRHLRLLIDALEPHAILAQLLPSTQQLLRTDWTPTVPPLYEAASSHPATGPTPGPEPRQTGR